MIRIIFFVLVLVAAALLTPAAAAQQEDGQENRTIETDGNETLLRPQDSKELQPGDFVNSRLEIDGNAYVDDWEHDGETHTIRIGVTDRSATVLILPVIDTEDDTSQAVTGESVQVNPEHVRTRTVNTKDPIVVMTIDSAAQLEYVILDPENDVLIGGPWGVNDTRLAAASAAFSVAFMIVLRFAKRRLGAGLRPEWIR